MPGRALVPVEPASASRPAADRSRPMPSGRVLAPFLAHLIATEAGAAQTRERRRATPAEATGAYLAGGSFSPVRRAVFRSL